MADTDPCYLARRPCSCVVGVIVADPADATRVARLTGDWIRSGYAVERLTTAAVWATPFRCPGHPVVRRERAEQGVLI